MLASAATIAGLGVLFMGNPTTNNPNDTSIPHRGTKNGKSNLDKYSAKRSSAPEKKDSRMKYHKPKRKPHNILVLLLLKWLFGEER